MNFDEAMSEAVLGASVTCDFIGAGVYVDYNFDGWRINQPNAMGSSRFTVNDVRKAQDWRIVEDEAPKPKPSVWGRPRIALGEAGVPQRSQFYNPKLAEAITSTGQEALLAIERAATAPNVGTASPLSGLALARLERAKAAEPLPEPSVPAKPWGAPAAKPWGPGK